MSLAERLRSIPPWVWIALGGVVLLVLVVGGVLLLGGDPGEAPPEAVPDTTAPEPGAPETTEPGTEAPAPTGDRNPLTGLPAAGGPRQVVAVKVDNHPDAQPQVGIGAADLVVELPVEGGLTRFVALFSEGEPELLVGPVRSARPADAALLAPFSPLLAVSGGVEFVYRDVRAAGVAIADPASDPLAFQRLERPAPYNLMVTFETLRQQADGDPPPVEPYPFGEGPLPGSPAGRVEIGFSGALTVAYEYREGAGYVRSENGIPSQVLPTHDGSPEGWAFDTVLVQFVAQRGSGYVDGSGFEVPTFDLVGFGRALVFHGGVVTEAEWRRASQAEGTLFFDAEGQPLRLPPGRMMVEIVPRGTEVGWS